MKAIDDFYFRQAEPIKSTLLALKSIILSQDKEITNEWKYGMPFFCYRGKMFCYLCCSLAQIEERILRGKLLHTLHLF